MAKPKGIEQEIKRLREEGFTYPQIEAELGCTRSTISYWVGKGNENSRAKKMQSRNKIKGFIKHLKETTTCADCGLLHPYYKMQFDHLPGHEKLFTIAKFYDYTMDLAVIMAEIKKCELVCGNCHADRTHSRREEKKELSAQVDTTLTSGLN